MSFELLGIGTATPAGRLTARESAALHETLCLDERDRRRIRILHRQSGVRSRAAAVIERPDAQLHERQHFHPPQRSTEDRGRSTAERMAFYEEHAPPLAAEAARRALADAGVAASEIAQSVTVSCTGFFAPGLDARLIELAGLPRTVGRTHVGFQGCHGALNGLRVARGLASAEPGSLVLVTAAELCSPHATHGWDPERSVATALFADGAAAVVGRTGAGSSLVLRDNAAVLLPESEEALQWRIGDHGFEMRLSPGLPGLIERHLRGWLEEWLGRRGLRREDVAGWAVHPGGPRVLDAVEEALELPGAALEHSRAVLAEHGNMSSPTVLFVLDRMRRSGSSGPVVALGFGPGLAIEAALFA